MDKRDDAQDLAGLVDEHFKESGDGYGVAFISEKDRIGFPVHVLQDGIGDIGGFDDAYEVAQYLLNTDDKLTTDRDRNFIWFQIKDE